MPEARLSLALKRRVRHRSLLSGSTLVVLALVSATQTASASKQFTCGLSDRHISRPVIHTEDVQRFYDLYRASEGHPNAEQLQHRYLDVGSEGLHALEKQRNVSGIRIAENMAADPEMYVNAKRCMAVLPRVRERLLASFGLLARLYPEAKFPPVTIVVGRGKPSGIADAAGVEIGLESLCAVTWMEPNLEDRFVHVIAHEYAHVQQALAVPAVYNDQNPTVLEESLIEGAAEFIAELTSGSVSDTDLKAITRGHEKEIETEFVADEAKTDLSKWLYNGTLTKPGDLGYWVGYRIVETYYRRAPDKCNAIRDILQMREPNAFLARSGWYPGIVWQQTR